MAANKNVQSFYELRAGFQGMLEFSEAALRFMDENGIAVIAKRAKRNTNGTGSAFKDVTALTEKVKRQYTQRRGGAKRNATTVAEPDGLHVSTKEAAKLLKCSDANIRLMMKDGRLPKPTYEARPMGKKGSGRTHNVMVIPREAVEKYRDARAN